MLKINLQKQDSGGFYMLYTADQARQKTFGKELDDVTNELEIVEKAIKDAIERKVAYCVVFFHIKQATISKLEEWGYDVSLNVTNKYTYISWVS